MSEPRGAGWGRWLAATAIALGLLLVTERLWTTDTEAIAARLADLGDAIEAKDPAAALDAFAAEFDADGIDRPMFGAALTLALSKHAPSRTRVREVAVTLDGDRAASSVRWDVTGRVESQPVPGLVDVTFTWRRGPDGWRIDGIDATKPFAWSALLGEATEPLHGRLRALARSGR